MCVCMYSCTYVCMYVFMYAWLTIKPCMFAGRIFCSFLIVLLCFQFVCHKLFPFLCLLFHEIVFKYVCLYSLFFINLFFVFFQPCVLFPLQYFWGFNICLLSSFFSFEHLLAIRFICSLLNPSFALCQLPMYSTGHYLVCLPFVRLSNVCVCACVRACVCLVNLMSVCVGR